MVNCIAIMTEIFILYRDATGQSGPGPASDSALRAVIYHFSNKVTRFRELDRESGDDQRYTDLLSPEDVPTEASEGLHIVLDSGSGGEQLSTEQRVRPRCHGRTLSGRPLAERRCSLFMIGRREQSPAVRRGHSTISKYREAPKSRKPA